MAPRTLAAKLSTLVPTEEELKAARMLLNDADAKKKASIKAGMKHYLKNNPDDSIKTIQDKHRFLNNFLVVQARSKEATNSSGIGFEMTTQKRKGLDIRWLAKEMMDATVGKMKGDHWRNSGLLKPRPDMLTGSTHEDLVEWPVPAEWESMAEQELQKFWLDVSNNVDDDETMAELKKRRLTLDGVCSLGSTSASSTDAAAVVKTEPSAMDGMARRVVDLQANSINVLKEFQGRLLLAQQVQKKALTKNRLYEVQFVADLKQHVGKMSKLIGILQKMAVYETQAAEVPKVIETIDGRLEQERSLRDWYVRYGYCNDKEVKIGKTGKKSAADTA